MARLRKFITWFRDAAAPKRAKPRAPNRHHATMQTASAPGRWTHRSIAKRYDVPEDIVRRIYAAVQTAKRQGLHGGYMVDFIERHVGRKLVGNEYTVETRAREHLKYDPPGGYGGPKPKASAKEPSRVYDETKRSRAARMVERADSAIKDVLRRRNQWSRVGWDEAKDHGLLHEVADELDVAADLYEEAGAAVRAGTLRERARHARRADYQLLAAYE